MKRFGLVLAAGLIALVAGACAKKKNDTSGLCSVGATKSCYGGPAATQGVGTCSAGVSTCGADHQWGACLGAVLPSVDVCANGLDENCNGVADDVFDASAAEFAGNNIDDDCDGTKDNVASCDAGLVATTTTGADFARAMEVCATASSAGTTGFGLISATLTRADGTGSPAAGQHAIRSSFGTNLTPRAGSKLSILSTGVASAVTDPGYVAPDAGTNNGTSSALPPDWLAANGSSVPASPGCPATGSATAYDPAMLTLTLRVPDNAHAVVFDAFFLTADYPEYVCSSFTDLIVALLDSGFSGTPANPLDKNIARSNASPVISSSCAHGMSCPFTSCLNDTTGCLATIMGTMTGCAEVANLAGTGFDVAAAGKCSTTSISGGGTGWITAGGNVVPGETITLRIGIWDTSDGTLDSDVVLDNLRWLPTNITPGLQ